MPKKKNQLKLDPTRTTTLRRQFMSAIRGRLDRVYKQIRELVIEQDAFGLGPSLHAEVQYEPQRFRFLSSKEKLREFERYLRRLLKKEVLEEGLPDETESYWYVYTRKGYERGAKNAFMAVKQSHKEELEKKLAFFSGTLEDFLRQSFAQPINPDRVQLLASRVLTELRGITESMARSMIRVMADAMTQGLGLDVVGRLLRKEVDLTKTRADRIARTEIIRAHAEGQLDMLEELGVEEVGVEVEWRITPDFRVCEQCRALSGTVFKIDEARGLLPRHPNCRCAWIPAGVGESRRWQKRTKQQKKKAIKESVRAERPKAKLKDALEKTRWVGADLYGKR